MRKRKSKNSDADELPKAVRAMKNTKKDEQVQPNKSKKRKSKNKRKKGIPTPGIEPEPFHATNEGSIRHLFIVAYRPLSCHIRNAISYFFINFSLKSLAGLKIKS